MSNLLINNILHADSLMLYAADSLGDTLIKFVDPEIRNWFYDRPPRIEYYVTQTGITKIFINPFWIFEFPTATEAVVVSWYRFLFADCCRIMHLLLFLRFMIPFFGISPMDEGWLQAFWEMTGAYLNMFVGLMPSINGMDLGFVFAFYLLDRLDHFAISIIIIDSTGHRF